MTRRINEIVENLAQDPSIEGVVIYRVDGVPIVSELKGNKKNLEHLYFLESQIKSMLHYVFTQNLNESSIKISGLKIKMYPITKTLVLTLLSNPSADFRTELEVKRVINALKNILSNEF